jgi:hypothetical protein
MLNRVLTYRHMGKKILPELASSRYFTFDAGRMTLVL